MRDVTMEASRRRRSIWWWFWTYFVANTLDTTLFSHVIIEIDHGRSELTATTPSWFVTSPVETSLELRSQDVPAPDNKSLGCCRRDPLRDEYDVTTSVPSDRVTSQINCGDATMLKQKRPWRHCGNGQSLIVFIGFVCSGHKISRQK